MKDLKIALLLFDEKGRHVLTCTRKGEALPSDRLSLPIDRLPEDKSRTEHAFDFIERLTGTRPDPLTGVEYIGHLTVSPEPYQATKQCVYAYAAVIGQNFTQPKGLTDENGHGLKLVWAPAWEYAAAGYGSPLFDISNAAPYLVRCGAGILYLDLRKAGPEWYTSYSSQAPDGTWGCVSLSRRTVNVMKDSGVAMGMACCMSDSQLRAVDGIGPKAVAEIRCACKKLAGLGLIETPSIPE